MSEILKHSDHEPLEMPSNIRESYIRSISSIISHDAQERMDIAQTLEWLKGSSSLNKPHNMDEHLGVLVAVLSPARSHTFLLRHKKAGLWLPPGGHVDLGQTFVESVCMEMREELSIDNPKIITDGPIFLTRTITQGSNAGHVDVTVWFALEGDPSATYLIQEKEATESSWMRVEEVICNEELSNLHRGFQKMHTMHLVSL